MAGLGFVSVALVVGRRSPALPNPNGYDRLMVMANSVPKDVPELVGTNAAAFARFAATHSTLVDEVQAALRLPAAVPVNYSNAWLTRRTPELMSLRRLEKALLACAHHLDSTGDLQAATAARLAGVKLGQQGTRGGLLIDFMVGSATQINGLTRLSNSLPRMDLLTCGFALAGLKELEASQELLSSYVGRERHWMLVGSEWWRDWDAAKELPVALLKPASQAAMFGGTANERWLELQSAFAGTEVAILRRLADLDKPDAKFTSR